MKNKLLILIAVFLLLIPVFTHAEEFDPSIIGSVKINYKYGDSLIPGADATMYKIANLGEYGIYEFVDGIGDYNLDNITSSQLGDVSKQIEQDVIDNNIESFGTCTTQSDGACTIEEVPVGVYLIKVESIKIDKTTYYSLPTLIVVPTTQETSDILLYDTEIYMKVEADTEKEEVPVTPDKDENTIRPDKKNNPRPFTPNTVDRILMYAALFCISLVIIIVVIMIIKKGEEEKNEKDD